MNNRDLAGLEGILGEVVAEIEKAEAKHGPQMHLPLGFSSEDHGDTADWATYETDMASQAGECTWMHIAREEVFETFAEDDPQKARAEALQAAAMFVQIVRKIDYDRG